MIKYYCDICGEETPRPKVASFRADIAPNPGTTFLQYKGHTLQYIVLKGEVDAMVHESPRADLCRKCVGDIFYNGKEPESIKNV